LLGECLRIAGAISIIRFWSLRLGSD